MEKVKNYPPYLDRPKPYRPELSACKVCERITDANKDIFYAFARTHQPEDKDEFCRVPVRFCPACGREIDRVRKFESWEEKENRYVQKDQEKD